MGLALKWLLVFGVSILTAFFFQGPLYYQKTLIDSGRLVALGREFNSVWIFRIGYYFQFLPLWFLATLAMFWLVERAVWFENKIWVIQLTLLLAGQLVAGFGINYFNKGELPDWWMIIGVSLLFFCMLMSAITHYQHF